MRHIAAAISLTALSAAATAQTLNWGGIVQQGVNEVIRSMNTPAAPAPYSPPPVYKPSAPSSSQYSPPSSPKVSKTRSIAEQNVDTRISDNRLGSPAEFRTFLNRLKKAVTASDKQTLAKMMKYPLSVTRDNLKVFTEKDFIDNYDLIFTPPVVAAVKKQSYGDLFVRDQGASIGSGVVWFTGVCANKSCNRRITKVVTINAPPTTADTARQVPAQPSSPAQRTGTQVVAGSSLPTDPVPGEFGPCKNMPAQSGPGSLTITGALEPDGGDCYRLAGRNGQTVHIELVSVASGFNIAGLAENRYELEFKARNKIYDIMLAHTFPNSPPDHYELHVTFR